MVRYPLLPYLSAKKPITQVTIHATAYTGTLSRLAGVALNPSWLMMLGKKSENAYSGPSAPVYSSTVHIPSREHSTPPPTIPNDSLPTQVFQSKRLCHMYFNRRCSPAALNWSSC